MIRKFHILNQILLLVIIAVAVYFAYNEQWESSCIALASFIFIVSMLNFEHRD